MAHLVSFFPISLAFLVTAAAAGLLLKWPDLVYTTVHGVKLTFASETWKPGKGADLADTLKWPIVFLTAAYLPVCWLLQRHMHNKPAYSLRSFAFAWNAVLSALSLAGFMLAIVTQPKLLVHAVFPERQFAPMVRLVIAVFTLTKAVEFGDTFILLLKKKPVPFLHVYHHFTVTLYCLHAQYINVDFAHGFVLMNLGVHALMYGYYAFSCVSRSHPLLRRLRPLVTTLQLLQMLMGMFLSVVGLLYCRAPEQIFNAKMALAMYTSYAFLFAKLYCQSYLPQYGPNRFALLLLLHGLAALGGFRLYSSSNSYSTISLLLEVALLTIASLALARCTSWYAESKPQLCIQKRSQGQDEVVSGSAKDTEYISHSSSTVTNMWLTLLLIANWVAGLTRLIKTSIPAIASDVPTAQPQAPRTSQTEQLVEAALPHRRGSPVDTEPTGLVGNEGVEGDMTRSLSMVSTVSTTTCTSSGTRTPAYTPRSSPTSCRSLSDSVTNKTTEEVCTASPNKGVSTKDHGNTSRRGLHLSMLLRKQQPVQLRSIQWAAVVAGLLLPAAYGQWRCGDPLLGFCLYGATRWALEFHIARMMHF